VIWEFCLDTHRFTFNQSLVSVRVPAWALLNCRNSSHWFCSDKHVRLGYTKQSKSSVHYSAGPDGCVVYGVGLQPLYCWDRAFESRWGNGCSSLVSCVCCVGSGLCDGLITRSKESYCLSLSLSLYVCVCVCNLETSQEVTWAIEKCNRIRMTLLRLFGNCVSGLNGDSCWETRESIRMSHV